MQGFRTRSAAAPGREQLRRAGEPAARGGPRRGGAHVRQGGAGGQGARASPQATQRSPPRCSPLQDLLREQARQAIYYKQACPGAWQCTPCVLLPLQDAQDPVTVHCCTGCCEVRKAYFAAKKVRIHRRCLLRRRRYGEAAPLCAAGGVHAAARSGAPAPARGDSPHAAGLPRAMQQLQAPLPLLCSGLALHPEQTTGPGQQAAVAMGDGTPAAAEAPARAALGIRAEALGRDSSECAACLNILADVLSELSRSLMPPSLPTLDYSSRLGQHHWWGSQAARTAAGPRHAPASPCCTGIPPAGSG